MFKQKFGSNNVKSPEDLKKVKIGGSAKERAAEVWSTDATDALHVSILDADLKKSAKEEKYATNLINPFGVYDGEKLPVMDEKIEIPVLNVASEHIVSNDLVSNDSEIADQLDVLASPELMESPEAIESREPLASAELDDASIDLPLLDDQAVLDECLLEESVIETVMDQDIFAEIVDDVLVDAAAELAMTESAPVVANTVTTAKQESSNEKISNDKRLVGIYSPNAAFMASVQKELESMGEAWVYCFDGSVGMSALDSLPNINAINTWVINLLDDDESDLLDTVLDESADADTMYLSGTVLSKLCKEKLKSFLDK